MPFAVATLLVARLDLHFAQYAVVRPDEVALSVRASTLHPEYGHLGDLSGAERDQVWNAVLKAPSDLAELSNVSPT